jgi:hypothetical protein
VEIKIIPAKGLKHYSSLHNIRENLSVEIKIIPAKGLKLILVLFKFPYPQRFVEIKIIPAKGLKLSFRVIHFQLKMLQLFEWKLK